MGGPILKGGLRTNRPSTTPVNDGHLFWRGRRPPPPSATCDHTKALDQDGRTAHLPHGYQTTGGPPQKTGPPLATWWDSGTMGQTNEFKTPANVQAIRTYSRRTGAASEGLPERKKDGIQADKAKDTPATSERTGEHGMMKHSGRTGPPTCRGYSIFPPPSGRALFDLN